ncbi:ABC transporter ATP-binding protein/permease [Apilactobacillus kunkeei]|uniref:ABC transporter ATP-binding protein n=1 Tax=Apilactobacillus kunkeei TaxID=148814 RepID=UPI00200A8A37|nr:ABC transporter ATP-binding protein [Apilactobacillus kunkeei]MCK8635996.1 ABC transporter ATP-binding protein/permease [Apilactobacillus kunkeei]
MKEIIQTIQLIWKQHKILFSILIFINIVLGILPLISIFFVQLIINFLSLKSHFLLILWCFAGYISVSLITDAISSVQSYINGIISNMLSFEVEYDILKVVSKMDITSFENEETYSVIDKLSNEAPSKPFSVFTAFNSISVSIITIISSYFYIFKISSIYGITLILLTFFSIPFLLILSNNQFNVHWNRAEKERKAWYIKYLLTHDFSVKEIIFFDLSKYLKKKFSNLKKEFISQDLKILKKLSIFNYIYDLMVSIVTAVLVISVIWSIYLGRTLLGTLTSVTQIISLTQGSTQTFINNLFNLKYDLQILRKLYGFIDDNENEDNGICYDLPIKRIEFKDVSYSYKDNMKAVDNVSFDIKQGEIVAIVGANGSGKSTIVKILTGLYKPTNGKYLINNIDSTKINKHSFHKRISVLFQNFVQYELSVRENIGFGDICNIKQDDKIMNTLDTYNDDLYKKLKVEDSLGNWFGNGKQLSGGQWQSIATSRAFFNKNASFVILDEPNSALDSISESNLFSEFKKFISHNKMGLFISHRIGAVKNADKIIVMSEGRIIAEGSHEYLLKNSAEYKKLEEAERYE